MADAVKDATEQQTLAAQPDYQIHVEANAGSGKTRVLVNRVARLLLDGAKPDKILCLTYTRAAAGEMKSRLFDTLGSWSIADDAALTKKLNALHNDEGGSYSRDALADARRLFARALETPGGLAVQTIHAFCQSLLQRFPLEAGLAPGFEVADDGEARAIAAKARRGLLLEAGRNSGLHTALATLHNRGSDAFELVTRTAASKRLALAHLLIAEGGAVLRSALRRELGLSEQETVASLIDSAWADAPHAALRSAARRLRAEYRRIRTRRKRSTPRSRPARRTRLMAPTAERFSLSKESSGRASSARRRPRITRRSRSSWPAKPPA